MNGSIIVGIQLIIITCLAIVLLPSFLSSNGSTKKTKSISKPPLISLEDLPATQAIPPIKVRTTGKTLQEIIHPLVGTPALTPQQIRKLYNLPDHGGVGKTIEIIVAYTTPTLEKDLAEFSKTFGLPQCTQANGCLEFFVETPSDDPSMPPDIPPTAPAPIGSNWDLETTLDVEWAHAIAPDASILVVQTNSAKLEDLDFGLGWAQHDLDVRAVSMSWIFPEFAQESDRTDFDFPLYHDKSNKQGDTNGSTIPLLYFAASGDGGHGATWPAVDPHVIAVGGTSLIKDANANIIDEVAWPGSGGGESQFLSMPDYQKKYLTNPLFSAIKSATNRVIPDIALNADNIDSPYAIYFNGAWATSGGTSSSTPIVAAMSLLSDDLTAFFHENLYATLVDQYNQSIKDITHGSNGSCGASCSAQVGFDEVTGFGAPRHLPFIPAVISPPVSPPSSVSPAPPSQPSQGNLSITVYLHGIGHGGDNANPSSLGTLNPNKNDREIQTYFVNDTNSYVKELLGRMKYDPSLGGYKAEIPTTYVQPGSYTIVIRTGGYLSAQVPGIHQITATTTGTLPDVRLVAGDLNNDLQINILDFNMLISCFGSKQTTASCLVHQTIPDLTDDGLVDGADYNLLLRELSVQKGA